MLILFFAGFAVVAVVVFAPRYAKIETYLVIVAYLVYIPSLHGSIPGFCESVKYRKNILISTSEQKVDTT